jgi:hypothetical protein
MKPFVLNTLVSLFVVAVGIAAYHHYVRSAADRIGVIDVTEVYRLKEKEFTDLVTKAGASEIDKDRAMAGVEAFARALPQALEELPHECGCLVLLRNAIAANTPAMIDLTPALKRKVGL